MRDGMISCGTPRGKLLGFTRDKFDSSSYLWKVDGAVYISLMIVREGERGKGHFRALMEAIHARGWTIKVPTPTREMTRILVRNGYTMTVEESEEHGRCIVWVKPAPGRAKP